MGVSEVEINMQRLLERTKRLSRDRLSQNTGKLSASVAHLEVLFSRLQDDKSLDRDVLFQYGREVQLLKGIVLAEQQKSVEERIRLLDLLPSTFDCGASDHSQSSTTTLITSNTIPIEQVKARSRAVYTADLRAQLLSGGRRRLEDGDNVDELVRSHDEMQSDLAEELYRMASAMKQTLASASNVIREDNTVLSRLHTSADANRTRLETESRRLQHHAYASIFDCLLLLIVVAVVVTFVGMVLVMRVFTKPRI